MNPYFVAAGIILLFVAGCEIYQVAVFLPHYSRRLDALERWAAANGAQFLRTGRHTK